MLELRCGTCARRRMIPVCLGGTEHCNKHCKQVKWSDAACFDYKPGAKSVLATIARFMQAKEGGAK